MDEKGVSELIGVLLILSIFIGFLAMLQVYSIPEWNKEVEYDHFDVVYDDFLKLKTDIEDVSYHGSPKTAIIHLGVKYPNRIILRNPGPGTWGELVISPDKWINVSYNGNSWSMRTCTITFYPNHNYANTPKLVYEHGILIKDYGSENFTSCNQSIIAGDNIYIPLINSSKIASSSIDSETINLFPYEGEDFIGVCGVNLSISTDYPDVWREILSGVNTTNTTAYVSGNRIIINSTATREILIPKKGGFNRILVGFIRFNVETTTKTVSFYPWQGFDSSDGSADELNVTDLLDLRYDDDERMVIDGSWPTGSFDEGRYLEFHFNPGIPDNAEIYGVNVVHRYMVSPVSNATAKLEVYNSTGSTDFGFDITTFSPSENEDITDITSCIKTTEDLKNMKIRFLAWGDGSFFTEHDLFRVDVTCR